MHELFGVAYLLFPLLGGAAIHGLCMKFGWLGFLARPVDAGLTCRGKRLFGANKTIRGIVAVGAGASLLFGIQTHSLHLIREIRLVELFDYSHVNGWILGFVMGVSAMLSELPNSFLKRQLNAPPGGTPPDAVSRLFFLVVDQIDLLCGVWLVLFSVVRITITRIALSIIIVFTIHQIVTQIGYALGIQSRRFREPARQGSRRQLGDLPKA